MKLSECAPLDKGELARHGDLPAFLHQLQLLLLEAVPRRYGLYEPPQQTYAETGRPYFEAFVQDHLHEGIVWYPYAPVADVTPPLEDA